jgi:hypothetical protein
MLRALIFISVLVSAQLSQANVWQTTRQWDQRAESEYADWVRTQWSEGVFILPTSPYRGIETDCAHATYAMRIIFAFEHGLPIQFLNHNVGGRAVISNEMKNWDGLKDANAKIRGFLGYVFGNTSTRTLGLDTYPVAVTAETINAGTIYVDPGNHSVQVIDLTPQGVPVIQFSTVPSSVRFLTRLIGFPEMIPGQAKTNRDDGFRRFKTPEQIYLPVQKIPGYSLEQFSLASDALGDWNEYTKIFSAKLARVQSTPNDRATNMIQNICQAARDRVKAVRDGIIVSARNRDRNLSCMDGGDYYNTSTPDRDKVLREYFVQLQKLSVEQDFMTSPKNNYYHRFADFIVGNDSRDPNRESQFAKESDQNCDLSKMGIGGPLRSLLLPELYQLSIANKLISDPNATLEQRWGLEAYAPLCKQY